MKKETLEQVSPMNDLLQDLKETKVSVKESIDIIEDEFMRTQINIFVQKTLDSIIDRIENELLEIESKWQQERMYSEEDMQTTWNSSEQNMRFQFSSSVFKNVTFEKWFEQFKKK